MCFTHNYVLYKGLLISNVQNGKKENPNNVHKVPIQSNEFYSLEIVVFPDIKRNQRHDYHPAKNMKGMEPRCREIKRPENIFCESNSTQYLRRILVDFYQHEHQTTTNGKPNVAK